MTSSLESSSFADLSLLVSSFDQYPVCWKPFCHGLKKYWPDHPSNLFFITNRLETPCGEAIKVGEDRGWAGNLKYALEQVESEFVLYSQEDYWIQEPVNSQQVESYLDLLRQNIADYIRLYPAPPADQLYVGDERLGLILPHSAYRTSLQMALWRKSVLYDLLLTDESPWKFEKNGSARSAKYGKRFFCVNKRSYGINYVFTAVINGYWSKRAYEYVQKEDIVVNFDALPKKPFRKQLRDILIVNAYKMKKRILKKG